VAVEVNFAIAEPDQVAAAFKYAGLDEYPKYRHIISSIDMVKALKAEGYRAISDDRNFVRAIK
jgi:hypothetical protein